MGGHTFGGDWTEDKLDYLRKYLPAYRKILGRNKRARYFRTWYVDAFAGTGTRSTQDAPPEPLFEGSYEDPDSQSYRDGSAKIALGLESPFDGYLFIEKSKARLDELRQHIETHHKNLLDRCEFGRGDANTYLRNWVAKRDWKRERAVVFLDPYGMQVEWKTIERLAETEAIDLWYLFPLGIGVARLLARDGNIDKEWEKRLDLIFGTHEWKARFYEAQTVPDLFGLREELVRDAGEKKISAFVEERLKSCFVGVAKGLILRNSKSSPLYLLCFAASNERGAVPALKIAQSILGGSRIIHR